MSRSVLLRAVLPFHRATMLRAAGPPRRLPQQASPCNKPSRSTPNTARRCNTVAGKRGPGAGEKQRLNPLIGRSCMRSSPCSDPSQSTVGVNEPVFMALRSRYDPSRYDTQHLVTIDANPSLSEASSSMNRAMLCLTANYLTQDAKALGIGVGWQEAGSLHSKQRQKTPRHCQVNHRKKEPFTSHSLCRQLPVA